MITFLIVSNLYVIVEENWCSRPQIDGNALTIHSPQGFVSITTVRLRRCFQTFPPLARTAVIRPVTYDVTDLPF